MGNGQHHYLLKIRDLHRPLIIVTGLTAVLAVVALIGLFVDDRTITGASAWMKPLKFALSIGFYNIAFALLISLVHNGKRIVWWMGTVAAASAVLELAAIVGQVLRGRPSHFNIQTPLDTAIFGFMGTTIVTLWVATAVVTLWLWRADIGDRALTWAIRLGLVLSLAGMAEAFLMTGPLPSLLGNEAPQTMGGHAIGVVDGGPGLPLLGWSTTGGDLRVGHFIGLHALQLLPLLALALARLARSRPWLTPAKRTRLSLVAAGAYAGLLVLTTWQALRGEPLVYPTAATVIAGLVLVVAVALGVRWAMLAKESAVMTQHRERESVEALRPNDRVDVAASGIETRRGQCGRVNAGFRVDPG